VRPVKWDVTVREATKLQTELRSRLRQRKLRRTPQTIAGADISHSLFSKELFASVVVLSLPDLEVVERADARGIAKFPYVPGYLSFREVPTLLKAFKKLKRKPDVVMADGQGIAHPRRMGLAAHLGLALGVPTFGCAKSILFGSAKAVGKRKGALSYLRDPKTKEVIGALVRAKEGCKPLVVSAGHLITLEEAIGLALRTGRGYRIPEPTRQAHNAVNELRRSAKMPR